VNTNLYPGDGKVKMVCPHGAGVKNYLPASWNQQTGILIMPLNEACMDIFPVPGGGSVAALSSGINWGIRPRPDSDGKYSHLEALDLNTRKPVWTVRGREPVSSGVLSTAGGVVFVGTFDRVLHAYDSASGKELWRNRLNDVSSSSPISF
jgi:alcohol dehydrogenase (cytochrome c)